MTSKLKPIGVGPVLVAAAGGGMLAWNASVLNTAVWVMVATLLLLAAAVSYWERKGVRATLAVSTTTVPYTQSLHDVSSASMTRWTKHIDLARSQTETAGATLTRDFSTIRAQLRDVLDSAGGNSDEGVLGVLSNSESDLQEMTKHLNQALEDQKPMFREVEALVKVTDDLKQMATAVGDIARQTNLLAINAAIEAARAGESGRGFAVVAAEVRRLSTESGALGKRIKDNVEAVNAAMTIALSTARQMSGKNEVLSARADETINKVLERFGHVAHGLSTKSKHLAEVSRDVRDKVGEVVVQLQFQDRTSQILVAVCTDIARLLDGMQEQDERLAQGAALEPFDVEGWVAELEKTYTTAEQFDGNHASAPAASQSTEMTFF